MTDKRRVRDSAPLIIPGGILGLLYACKSCGALRELVTEPCECRAQLCHGCRDPLPLARRVIYLCARCKAEATHGGMVLKQRGGGRPGEIRS